MIDLDRVTAIFPPGTKPMNSPYGYIIVPDGTVYALLHQWYHGVVLALLYPEELAKFKGDRSPDGLVIPEDEEDIRVMAFQEFELENHGKFPVIRVCAARFLGSPSVDRSSVGCTPQQVAAMRLVAQAQGWTARTEVETDHRKMKLSDMWQFLEQNIDVYGTKLSGEPYQEGEDDGEW